MKEFAQHLSDKVTQIYSQRGANLVVDLLEVPREESCPIIWGRIKIVGPEKVDRGCEFSHPLFGFMPLLAY